MSSRDGGPTGEGLGHGLGRGLVSGLAQTAKAMLRPSHTAEYPDVKPDLPPRSRGVIALLQENCTSCMLCARECPDWCIYIDSHKETMPAEGGGRPRQRNVLDRFAIDYSLCMYCGICIEACPFDALFWSPEFEYAEFDIKDLLHEKERLTGWMDSVPPPPPADPGSPESRELGVARAAAEKALAAHEATLKTQETQPQVSPAPEARAEPSPAAPTAKAEPSPAAPTAEAEQAAAEQASPPKAVEPSASPAEAVQPPETPTVTSGLTGPPAPALPPAGAAVSDPAASDPVKKAAPRKRAPAEKAAGDAAGSPARKAAPRKRAPAKKTGESAARKAAPRKRAPAKEAPAADQAPETSSREEPAGPEDPPSGGSP